MANATLVTTTCKVDGCDRGIHSRGMCGPHYGSWYRANVKKHSHLCSNCGKEFRTARTKQTESGRRFCSRDCSTSWNNRFASDRESVTHEIECPRCGDIFEHVGSGAPKYCGSECRDTALADHYKGTRGPLRVAYEDGDAKEFIRLVGERAIVDSSGCWVWQGRLTKDRYSVATIGGEAVLIYRAVLEAKEGAPLGSQAAHHKCSNSRCVNPDHLQPVTHRENTAEMLARKSLTARIRELEAALGEVAPGHELLKVIPVM